MAKQWLNCVTVCAVFTLGLNGLASSKFSSDRYCSKYHVLNEPWRSAQAKSLDLYGRHHCDNKDGFQTTRWYRFMGEAGTTMPTKPPPSSNRCGSDAPVWMNGINPTYEDGVVERQVCARFDKKICRWRWNIRVKRCPEGFLIYKLKPVKACSLTYCGLGIQNMTVDDVARPASNEDEDGSGALDNRKEDVHPACHHYITLDEPQRSVHYQVDPNTATNTLLCDKRSGLQHGSWYRFVGEGGVIMATERPLSTHRCGTHAPVWMRGPHPTIEEGVVTRAVCAFWDGNDCKWSWEIKVLLCPGDFFVYKLRKSTQCILAYCTTDGAPQTTVPSPTPSMSVELLSDEDDETGSGEPHIEDVPATESPDNAKDVGAGSPHTPERRTSYLTHHKGWDYYKVPVIGKMTSANVNAACEAAGYVTPCSGDSDCMHSSSECVLTGLEDCNNPMNEVAQEMCGTRPYGCAKLQGVYQYMNTWKDGAACGVESKDWCAIGSGSENRYAFCATDRNVTTTAVQATTATPTKEPRNCCGNILRQATKVVDQSSGYKVPDGWTMCYIDERDTAYHKTPCRDLLLGIPGYEDAEQLLVAGGNFGCWHGTTGDSPGPAFATNNVIENSCKDGVQQKTPLNSWNVRTTTLGVCIKNITCDGAPQTTIPPPTPSISDERLSDDEDDVGSGEPYDKLARKNLALGKRTKQSSLWDAGYPRNAVDGDRSTNWYSGSCTHTKASLRDNVWDIGTTDPWWYVDLESSHPIGKVVIVNRRSPKHSVASRINPFEIRIGNSKDVTANPKCGRRHVFPGDEDVMEVSCGGIQGRYVGIRLPGENRILTLCEVEVYAETAPVDDEDDGDLGSGVPYVKVDSLPCVQHVVIGNRWRHLYNTNETSYKCDKSSNIKDGQWHRFMSGRRSMMIPTERPLSTNRCGTHAPVWMKGKLPTEEEGVVTRAACAFWDEDECHWSWDIDVMACPGGYFVYKLQKPAHCNLAYCTTYRTPQTSDDEDEVGSGEPHDKGAGPQTTMPSTTTIPTPTEDPTSDDDDKDDADSGEVEGSVYSIDDRLACEKHYVLNEPWRSVRTHRERDHKCDQRTLIKHNHWYRFMGEGGTMIPTQRPPATHRCSTHAPVWMKGKHPTVEQGVVRRKVCAFWEEEECHWSWKIDVIACPGGYYVYKLPKPKICYSAYCTTDEDTEGSGESEGSGDMGYTQRGDTQYKIYTEEKTYDAAKQTCAADGGHLVSIETEAVYNFLLGMIRDVDVLKDYWIGLNDQADEQSWTWSDGKPLNDGGFTKWAPGEPNNNEGIQDCGQLWAYKNFQWDDDRCSYKKYFICQIGPGEAYDGDDIIFEGSGEEPLPTQENITGCPENNIVVLPSGKKYVASDDTKTYEDAQTECRSQGGIVAIPRDEEEQKNLVFLKNCVSRENQFWLGVRWSSEGWVDGRGSPLGGFTTWAPGEPNDRYNGYRCSHIVYGNKEGERTNKWADAYCNSLYNFVCEIENGTQYYKECWCGTKIPNSELREDDECATPCEGDQNEMCGGKSRLSVYKVVSVDDVEVPSEGPHDCQTSDGASYRGTVAVTRSGRTCQRWDRQEPHEHTRTSDNYPSSGLEENYCRNPDGTPGVWCYTTDPNKRWDFCDVPVCDVSPQTAMPSMTTVPSPTGRPDSDDDEDREVWGSAYTNEAVPENLATQPPISTEIAAKSGSLIENPSTQVPVHKAGTDATPTVCPISGYIRLRGACYKFFAEPKTYEDARQRCAEDGGLLAMPKDRATNRFVTNHHRGSSWLGLTDINREGRWVYEDGQLLKSSGYSSWARGEPNDADYIEDCAEFTPTRAFWNDAPCNSSKPFTCQIGVADVTSAIPTPTPEPTPTPTPTLASLSTPKVTTEGKVTVLKTSNVTLKCTLRLRRRHINHRINWYRIGENGTQGAPMITYIDRHAFHNYRRTAELRLVDRLEAVDDHVSLKILKAKVEDSGTYRCEVILASQQRAYADVNMTILECPTEKKKDHIIINKATPTELARSVDHHDHGGQSLVVISDTGSVFAVALFTGGVFFILFLIIGAVVVLVWRKRG